ncbi:MAG: hypothetical protein JJU37_09465 [Balneolaceae bacterium]|nr:hypothetical protein [Balneolaceae bacterium]
MFLKNKLSIFSGLLLLLMTFQACSDGSVSVDENVALIQGSVESSGISEKAVSNADVSAATVTAARISSNGSFDIISETETQVDASGNFTLEVDANSLNHIAVLVETNGETLKGYLSKSIENGQSYTIKPVNSVSTAEAVVFADIVAKGKADIVHKADIEAVVNQRSATAIRSSSTASGRVATAVENSADARMTFFSEYGEADAETKMDTWFEIMTEAQAEFESAISNNSSAEAKEAAFDALLDAKLFAYAEAGLSEVEISKLVHMQAKVKNNSLGSASSDIRSDVRASSSLLVALAVDNATIARAEASGMSQATISAISDAGAKLTGEVRTSAGTNSQIQAAFETYHEEVKAAIESDSSVEGSVIVTIDLEINAIGGAKFIFDSAISGILSLNILNDAYAEFAGSVRNSVESRSDSIGSVEAEAMADILLLINLF